MPISPTPTSPTRSALSPTKSAAGSPGRSPSRVSRRSIQSITPTVMEPAHIEAVVALFHHVLPSLTLKFLRKFLVHKDVRTLVLLVPEELVRDANPEDDVSSEEEDEDDEDDDEEEVEKVSAKVAGADYEEAVDEDGDDEDDEEAEEADAAAPAAPMDEAARLLLKRRLAGCVSYEVGERLGQKLVQVSLLGVRLRHQGLGIGSRLIKSLLSGEASGVRPEAAIAWADTKAIAFFKRHGLTDDPMINARYREVSAPWARATLMSAQLAAPVPDLTGAIASGGAASSWASASALDDQLERWRKTRLLEYSNELALLERYHAEIRMLREKVGLQQGHVAALQAENAKLRRDHQTLQTEFDDYRRSRALRAGGAAMGQVAAVGVTADGDGDGVLAVDVSAGDGAGGTRRGGDVAGVAGRGGGAAVGASSDAASTAASEAEAWIAAAEAEARAEAAAIRGGSRGGSASASPRRSTPTSASNSTTASPTRGGAKWGGAPIKTWTRDELQTELAREKPSAIGIAKTMRLREWHSPSHGVMRQLTMRHEACRSRLSEPSLCLNLFYGAPLAELQKLLECGFDEAPSHDPLGLQVFGRGWYFSRFASHAHHYTGGGGGVLLAQVAVGNAETVVARDAARGAPSEGFDSIVVPGRRLPSQAKGAPASEVNEEYVLFDGSQALPLCLLHYDLDD